MVLLRQILRRETDPTVVKVDDVPAAISSGGGLGRVLLTFFCIPDVTALGDPFVC